MFHFLRHYRVLIKTSSLGNELAFAYSFLAHVIVLHKTKVTFGYTESEYYL